MVTGLKIHLVIPELYNTQKVLTILELKNITMLTELKLHQVIPELYNKVRNITMLTELKIHLVIPELYNTQGLTILELKNITILTD